MRLKPYAKLSQRLIATHLKRPAHPFKLTFAVTFWCNYRCKTCNIWQMRPKDELTTEEIEKFFTKNPYFLWIDLTGGEPWLRKDFVDICKIILERCPDLLLLHFPTNGYLTDRIVAGVGEIVKHRPERLIVTVSMDGDEKLNDELRGVEGGWKRQIETFKQLHEMAGVRVVLGMTLSGYNVDQFPAAFEAAKKECPWLTYRDFHVNIIHASGHFFRNTELQLREHVDPQALIDAVNQYRLLRGFPCDPVSFLEHEYLRRVERYLRTGVTPIRCHALRSSCYIDSWGQVFPCSIYDRKLGSLRETDFELAPLWNSPLARQVQQEIWGFQCPQCWTPCEAYQSILGNFFRPGSAPR
jgi:radical SAM protein with 4Fe4S-binding SPASM domain